MGFIGLLISPKILGNLDNSNTRLLNRSNYDTNVNETSKIKKNMKEDTKKIRGVYHFTRAPIESSTINATVAKYNTTSSRIQRSILTYRNTFNKTRNGDNHTSFWRNGNTPLRRNRTTTLDNVNGELREVDITKLLANETIRDLMYDKETKQSLSMKIANPLMITVMCLASKVTSLFFIPGNIDEFFSQLLIVDKILKYHPKFHADQGRFVKDLLVYSFIFSVPINIHYLYTVIEVNNEFGIMWCCILIYTNLASFLLDLHFIYFNYLLYIRYKYINRQIKMAFNKYCQNNVVFV